MKAKFVPLLVAFSLAAAPAMANESHHVNAASTPITDTVQAEVLKVQKDARKITLKHGDLKNIGMPAMTMAFTVADGHVLDAVKQGDAVTATIENVKGDLKVTRLEPAR